MKPSRKGKTVLFRPIGDFGPILANSRIQNHAILESQAVYRKPNYVNDPRPIGNESHPPQLLPLWTRFSEPQSRIGLLRLPKAEGEPATQFPRETDRGPGAASQSQQRDCVRVASIGRHGKGIPEPNFPQARSPQPDRAGDLGPY